MGTLQASHNKTGARAFAQALLRSGTLIVIMMMMALLALAQGARAQNGPSLESDKSSYTAGGTVTLTGSGWGSSEVVGISVDDDKGNTWKKVANVTADANGQISLRFALPSTLAANYTASALGEYSERASATFSSDPGEQAGLVSDKDDYAPGEISWLGGWNFQPGESIYLTIFIDDPEMGVHVNNYDWTYEQADEQGTFLTSFGVPAEAAWMTLTATAKGLTSGRTATAVFTDAPPVVVSSINPSSGPLVGGTAVQILGSGFGPETQVTYTVTIGGTLVPVNRDNHNQLTVTVPPGVTLGAVDVVVYQDGTPVGTLTQGYTYGVPVAETSSLTASATTGTYGGTTTLSATLKDGNNNPLSGKTISFTLNGNTFTGNTAVTNASGIATLTGVSLSGINAGTYATGVGASFAGAAPFPATSATGSLTVSTKAITVTADAKSKVYGDADPALTFTNDGGLQVTDFTGSLSRAAGESVAGGPYAIGQGSLSAGANYAITFVDASFTITAKSITVTADAKTKVYGDADPVLTFTNDGGLRVSDFSGSLTRAAGESVAGGPYAIGQGSLSAGGNYSITFVGANFTITAIPLTITADAKTKVYGDADPALTYQVTSGSLVNGDSVTGALTRATGEGVAGSPYAIQQGSVSAGGNYSINFIGANLAVTPRAITVTADAKTKVYGSDDPALTYAITSGSLVAGDSISGNLTRVAGETVAGSPYAIQKGTLSAGSNYCITFAGANLSITRKGLTVTAISRTGVYSDPLPVLGYDVTGFAGADTVSVVSGTGVVTTTASVVGGNIASPAGVYSITVNAGNLSAANYSFTTVNGTLTVCKESATSLYTGESMALTASATTTSASVPLSAQLTEVTDATPGNIALAKARFEIFKFTNAGATPDYVVSNVPVNSTGYATANISLPTGDPYTVKVKIESANGYWTAPVATGTITVAVGGSELRVTGGGWIPDAQSGNGKANFGFTVNYQKTGTPKGNSVFVFRGNGSGGTLAGYTYVVKSNSWSGGGLSFNGSDLTKASFSGKCSIQAFNPEGVAVSSTGNSSYSVDIQDMDVKCTPKQDKYAITVIDGATGQIFRQAGTRTSMIVLGGGNIKVHSK